MATVLADVTSSEFLDSRGNCYAEEWAAYKQALARVIALDPERLSMGAPMAPLNRLDEAAVALCTAAWEAGAVVGDAFARAGRSLESERRICPRCHGDG